MEIPIKAKVYCQDEHCGHIGCVVINPTNEKITHIVVEEDEYPHEERIIPVGQIKETTSDSVYLSCTRDELSEMEDFVEHRFIHVDKVHGLYPARRHVYLPYGWPIHENFAEIKQERIPPGQITFHRGAEVKAVDGTVGQVDEFLVDPESGHITHLVMRKDHLWGEVEKTIPVSEIDHVEENTVYLKLDKAGINSLPDIPIERRF